MSLNPEHVNIARSLPPRLLRFFQKFPPSAYQGRQQPPSLPNTNSVQSALPVASTASPSDPNESNTGADDKGPFNPFLPAKNHATGKWRSPVFSLRRQAEICNMARAHGVEDWLPWSKKLSWVKEQKRVEQGLRVKGTGVGQKVKGHMWERTMKGRLEKRRQAMLEMPKMIREWKERGHGRGWKKWPSGRASG